MSWAAASSSTRPCASNGVTMAVRECAEVVHLRDYRKGCSIYVPPIPRRPAS